MTTILYVVIAFLTGFLLPWLLKSNTAERTKLQEELRESGNKLAAKEEQLNGEMRNAEKLQEQIESLSLQLKEKTNDFNNEKLLNRDLQGDLKHSNELLNEQKEELENIGKKFETQFQLLAQKILDEKTESFDKHQQKSLNDILSPLKENIDNFKKEIGERYTTENNERISLKEQIRIITDTNKLLTEQAMNLTHALQGQVKQQGNWGEMMLESILEYSGLQKDLHYFIQERLKDEDGRAFLPDIIVRYPDGRNIIIDSKVSLVDYVAYCSCDNPEEQEQCLQALLQSLYNHIHSLSGKEYQQKIEALDFVMMFIPVEGAYITAMQNDMDMWRRAYSKKVLLISPTNLIPAMKLVYDLWKKDDINRDAQLIAGKAVKVYEKLAAFVEEFEKVGTHLERASASFGDAKKKLHTGKGNLLSQASHMKQMLKHNTPTRELPPQLVEEAITEDENRQNLESHP